MSFGLPVLKIGILNHYNTKMVFYWLQNEKKGVKN